MDFKCLRAVKCHCLSLLFFTGIFFAHGQQTARKTSYGRGYLEFLPAGYPANQTRYPCIIYLHGAKARGNGSPTELDRIKEHGIPSVIERGNRMCFGAGSNKACFIVLSPQQSETRWGWKGDVIPFVQYALKTYKIDPCRLYLTGISMGGGGTWDASYDPANQNNYFAAIAPVSAGGDYHGAKRTARMNTPVWAFHGGADKDVPLSDGNRPINGMNSVSPSVPPIFTIYDKMGHEDVWKLAYDPSNKIQSPNLYEWFLRQKKCSPGFLALLIFLVRRKKPKPSLL